jgi:hypothetical protein
MDGAQVQKIAEVTGRTIASREKEPRGNNRKTRQKISINQGAETRKPRRKGRGFSL